MHRLQPVAHVRKRSAHDYAHRVIEVGALHLLLNRDLAYVKRLVAGGRIAQIGLSDSMWVKGMVCLKECL